MISDTLKRRDRTGIVCRPLPGEDGYGCHFIGSLISAGASILGGVLGRGEGEESRETFQDYGEQNVEELNRLYQEQLAHLNPYSSYAAPVMGSLVGGVAPGMVAPADLTRSFTEADFRADPGYQYRLSEGEKAINKGAAARGQFYNPETVRSLMTHNQGLADQSYNDAFQRFHGEQSNRYNRLLDLAGITQRGSEAAAGAGGDLMRTTVAATVPMQSQAGQADFAGRNALVGGLSGGLSDLGDSISLRNRQQEVDQMYNRTGATMPARPPVRPPAPYGSMGY